MILEVYLLGLFCIYSIL